MSFQGYTIIYFAVDFKENSDLNVFEKFEQVSLLSKY